MRERPSWRHFHIFETGEEKESKGKKWRYQVINIERKGKKEGGIEDRRNGKFAQLQRNTFPGT